jgi:hypothetical protein
MDRAIFRSLLFVQRAVLRGDATLYLNMHASHVDRAHPLPEAGIAYTDWVYQTTASSTRGRKRFWDGPGTRRRLAAQSVELANEAWFPISGGATWTSYTLERERAFQASATGFGRVGRRQHARSDPYGGRQEVVSAAPKDGDLHAIDLTENAERALLDQD